MSVRLMHGPPLRKPLSGRRLRMVTVETGTVVRCYARSTRSRCLDGSARIGSGGTGARLWDFAAVTSGPRVSAGDLLQREFCERLGFAYSTFGYWRKRLRSPVVPRTRASEPLFELSPCGLGEDSPEWRVELDLGSGVML